VTRKEALDELRSIAGVPDSDRESIEQVPIPRLTRLAYQTAGMLREGMSQRVEAAVKVLVEPEIESSGVAPDGTVLTEVAFLALLDWLREQIAEGDSMEGSLAYEWGEDPDTYLVQGALRHGNSLGGQGFVRLIRRGGEAS